MRRHIFFIAGYDPRGVEGYYKRLGDAAAEISSISGLTRESDRSTSWTWIARREDVLTTFEFLHWDDIVGRHWRSKPWWSVQFSALRALLVYWRAGLLRRSRDGARAVRWALLVMGFFPIVAWAFTWTFAIGVGILASSCSASGFWLAAPAWVAAWQGSNFAWRRLNLEWLARGFACIVETAKGETPSWNERCLEFARRIGQVDAAGEADEIVIIGHSLGAILAMTTTARVLDLQPAPRCGLALATLGNIIPFYNWIEKGGHGFRDGARVATSGFVNWIDVTSGSDPASACRMGPLVGSAAAVKRWEPEFHRVLSPDRFRYIRRRPLDFHFQYLKRADREDGFDLIRMMCSAKPFFASAPI